MSIKDHIEYFLNIMSKEDFEIIGEIIRWDDEKKAAFLLAKGIFEENEEVD